MRSFLVFQLTEITEANRAGVSITLVVSIAVALWSASGGMAALVTGINVAHEEDEPKSFVAKRGKALLLTLGAVIVLVALVWLLAFLPAFIEEVGLGDAGRLAFGILRWPVLALLMVLALEHAVSHRRLRSGGAARLARTDHPRRDRRNRVVARRLRAVLVLHLQLRQLQQDLRGARLDRGRPALVVPQRVGRADRRRGRRHPAELS